MSDVESALLQELRALADVEGDAQSFYLERNGIRIAVEYTGGSSSHLVLRCAYDANAKAPMPAGYRGDGTVRAIRPMQITLRREHEGDRMAKAENVSREHQTGDEAFDREVYIDTPTVDPVLRAVLLPEVRQGALALFDLGIRIIVIDDEFDNVHCVLYEFSRIAERDGRAEVLADAFVKMVRGLPRVERLGGEHPGKPLPWLIPTVGALVIAGTIGTPMAFLGIASVHDCTESDDEGTSLKDGCGGHAIYGFAGGLAAALFVAVVVRPILRKKLSGRSDSGNRLRTAFWLAILLAFMLAFLAASTASYAW